MIWESGGEEAVTTVQSDVPAGLACTGREGGELKKKVPLLLLSLRQGHLPISDIPEPVVLYLGVCVAQPV